MQATRWFFFSVLVPSSLALLIVGMGCQGMPNSSGTSTTKTLSSVTVFPPSANVQPDQTQQFTATAKYSDGSTANVSTSVTWAVASSSIAAISATGLATGKASGSTSVSATLTGMSGKATLDVETATVTKTLTSVTVSPATANVNVGATQQFAATANYSDGSSQSIASSAVAWSISPSSVATINGNGVATGVSGGSATVTAAYSGLSGPAALTVNVLPITSIAVSPTSTTISVGGVQQFTATATYSNGSTANVTSSATWSSSNTSAAPVTSGGLAIAVGSGDTTLTASLGGTSGDGSLTVNAATITGTNIPLFHVDENRSGTNPNETVLTPSNVTSISFGKLFSYLVDGYVYGQPLLVSNLTIGGSTHNVLFAATENDSVYAFDSDNYGSGTPLWKTSLLQAGETPLTDGPIQPLEGVTSTPAIDTTTNTIYVVSTQIPTGGTGTFRLNALDITTGLQKPGSPVTLQASVPGANDTTLGTDCLQRAALLVLPGSTASVFIGFGGCHSGWLLAYTYDGSAFTQSGVYNMSPNLQGEGTYASAGGVWMGGGGPVSDGNYVYVTTGNGPWDGQTAFSDSILKFTQALQLEDYFTPYVYAYMDCADADLASGGLLLIPGTTELLAGGKTGKMYLVSSDDLGQEQNNDTGATQTLWFENDLLQPYEATCTAPSNGTVSGSADINSYEIFGTSAYFNGSVYLGITPTAVLNNIANGAVRQFPYSGTLSQGSYTTPNILEGSYGTTPFISANETTNGVLWIIDHGNPLQNSQQVAPTSAILRAYNANNLGATELYDSSINSGDAPGYGIKFTAPIAANGKVYISTAHDLTTVTNPQGELDVYGLK
jgi:hypothetical protein